MKSKATFRRWGYFQCLGFGSILRAIFLILLVSGASLSAIAQTGASRQLTLKHPGDSDFDAILNARYPGFADLENYRAIRPFLVLMRNDTPHSAMSYAIKWTIQSADGMSHELENHYVQKYFGPATVRRALSPGELRLISPLFNLSPAEFSAGGSGLIQLLSTSSSHPPYSSTNISSITATVDAAIYEDGGAAGPDHFQLIKRYGSIRDAEHDEGASLLTILDSNAAAGEVVAFLQKDIATGQASKTSGGDRDSIYALHRGEEAQTLLALYQRSGIEALRQRATAMATHPRATLSRLP
jgi:hypothetical protein